MKTTQRLLCWLLALCMVLSFAPASALAAAPDGPETDAAAAEAEAAVPDGPETEDPVILSEAKDLEMTDLEAKDPEGDPSSAPPAQNDAMAAPAANEPMSGEAFTTQPTGGNVEPDGTYTVRWATNFTPKKIWVGYLVSSYGSSTFYYVKELSGSATSYAIPYNSVLLHTSYDWYVRAFYGDGDRDYIASTYFTMTTTARTFTTQPTGGNVEPDGTYTLRWATNFQPTRILVGYLVSSYGSSTFYYVKELDGSATSYPLPYNSVVKKTSYDWYVRAFYGDGDRDYVASNDFTMTATARTFTTQPEGGTVAPEGSYTLRWATNFQPTKIHVGYLISSYGSSTFYYVKELSGSATSCSLPYNSVVKYTSFDWYVRAYYGDGDRDYVSSYDFEMTATPRKFTQSPSNVTIPAKGRVTLNWDTNFTIQRVEIYASNNDTNYVLFKSLSGAAKACTVSYLESVPAYYRIRAFYGSGESDYAESSSFTITPQPYGFSTLPPSEVYILPQSTETIHWALNFTPVKIELYSNAGTDGLKRKVATLSASATSYALPFEEAQEYWLQVYYGSGSGEFYFSNTIYAYPTDYSAEEVGDCHLYLDPDTSETVSFTANFNPTRIEVWTSDLQYSNRTMVETLPGTTRSYSIGYDFDELAWFQLYYTDLDGAEQYKSVLYFVHHSPREFTTQPQETYTVSYGDSATVSWRTNFQPTRIEVIRTFLDFTTYTTSEERVYTLSAAATSTTIPKGNYYHIRAFYMTKTGEGYLDSVGIDVQEEGPQFTAQPNGGTLYPEGSLTLSWATSFVPTKIQVGFKTTSGIWNTQAAITTGLKKSMSYALAYDTAIHGDMLLRVFYGSGQDDYLESDPFDIYKYAHAFTLQPTGGTVYPWETHTVQWRLNFTPVKVEIGTLVSNRWGVKFTLTENLGRNGVQVIDYDTATNSSGWRIRAYYGTGSSQYAQSSAFTMAKKDAYACGPNLTAVLENSRLTLSGTGQMYNYSSDDPAPWHKVRDQIKYLTVPSGVTYIGEYAFASCTKLSYAILPPSIESIGYNAFYNCGALSSVSYDGFPAQWNAVDVDGGNTRLLNASFSWLYRSGRIGSTNAWWNLYGSSGKLVISNGLSTIHVTAPWQEWGEYITQIEMSYGEAIWEEAFRDCPNVKVVYLPSDLELVDYDAFRCCTEITDVYYDGTQTDWDNITIRSGNTPLTDAALHTAPHEEQLTGDLSWSVDDGGLHRIWCDDSLMGDGEECSIPDYTSGTRTPWYRDYASVITAIRVEDGVEEIGNRAFSGLHKVQSAELADSITRIGNYAFEDCYDLETINIPTGLTELGGGAFDDVCAVREFRLPNTLQSIPNRCFEGCLSLRRLYIPTSITSIGEDILKNCDGMEDGNGDVYYAGSAAQWAQININPQNDMLLIDANIHVTPEELYINARVFPDAVFRGYVSTWFDTDHNGFLSDAEIAAVESISIDSEEELRSVKGIELFTELTSLEVTCNPSLTAIDLSANTKLTYLDLADNELASLDLTGLDELTQLYVSGNQLGFLDVSGQTLSNLCVNSNPIRGLVLGAQPALSHLDCFATESRLKLLDVREAPYLLDAYQNGTKTSPTSGDLYQGPLGGFLLADPATEILTPDCVSIEVTRFPDYNLREYIAEHFDTNLTQWLTPAEIAAAGDITTDGLDIRSLEGIEYLTALHDVDISNAPNLTGADLRGNPNLTGIYFRSCGLTELQVAGMPRLAALVLTDDPLTELDLSDLPGLMYVTLTGSQLETLHLSGLPKMSWLDVSGTLLTEIDLSEQTLLKRFFCYGTGIRELDLSDCPYLCQAVHQATPTETDEYREYRMVVHGQYRWIRADKDCVLHADNDWVVVDDANFPDARFRGYIVSNIDLNGDNFLTPEEIAAVTWIECSNLGIASLKGIEYFTELTSLGCIENPLTELDLSGNAKLTKLWCTGCALTELDLSPVPELEVLACPGIPGLTSLNLDAAPKLVEAVREGEKTDFTDEGYDAWLYRKEPYRLLVDKSLQLTGAAAAPRISAQPESVTAAIGDAAVFSVEAYSEISVLSCQWQISADGGTSWTDLEGAVEETLSLTVTAELGGCLFRCVVTDSAGYSATSDAAALTLNGGLCGESAYWKVEDGGLVVYGTGAMADYSASKRAPWYDLRASLGSVRIEEGVTGIGAYAFSGCSAVKDVTIPNGVTSLGASAFADCTALTDVNYGGSEAQRSALIGSGWSTSGNDALFGAAWHYAIVQPDYDGVLPAAMKTLEEEALAGCAFRAVRIPDGAVEIGPRAFADSPRLAYVYIPASVTTIAADAFDGVPEGLTIIGSAGSTAENVAVACGFVFIVA